MLQMDMSPQNFPFHHHGVMRAAPQFCDPKRPVIVHALIAHGVERFDGFVDAFPIARNILSARLKAMVNSGLIDKVPQGKGNSRYFYLPTQKVQDLADAIMVAAVVPAGTPKTLLPNHADCGATLAPSTRCSPCGPPFPKVDSRTTLAQIPSADVAKWFMDGDDGTPAVINDHWSTRILACLFHTDGDGTPDIDTFDQLVAHLGIARNILAARLKDLVASGLVVRALYQTKPQRFRYRPSEAAHGFLPFLGVLGEWGREWCLPEGDTATRHRLQAQDPGVRLPPLLPH
jgi:DNA-binding HxlR family transcriptional regulator